MRTRRLPQNPQFPRLRVLPPGKRWVIRFWLIVPVLVLLGASAVYLSRVVRLLEANLPLIVAAEVTEQTHHQTRIGKIRLLPLGAVTIDNVAVSNRATFKESHGQSLLAAQRVVVHYHPLSLLFDSGNAAHSLSTVVVDRPQVLIVRLTKSFFNFSNIIKPRPHTAKKPFVGIIVVNGGVLTFRDYFAPAGKGIWPAQNRLADVDADVSFRSEGTVEFTANGRGTQGRVDKVAVRGTASRKVAGQFQVDLVAGNLDAPYWTDYFLRSPKANVVAGRADLDLTLARLRSKPPPGLPLDLLGRIAVRHGAVQLTDPSFRHLALQNINGDANFTGSGVAFTGNVLAGGQPAAINGTVFNFAHPELAATASSPSLDVRLLVRSFPAISWPAGLQTAPLAVTVNAVGLVSAPTIDVRLTLPEMQEKALRVTDVSSHAIYSDGVLNVPVVTLTTPGGGKGELHGIVLIKPAQPLHYRLAGHVLDADLAALRLPGLEGLELAGKASAAFLVQRNNNPLKVVADVSLVHPHIRHTTLVSARGRVVYVAGEGLTLSRALIRGAGGGALLAGTIPVTQGKRWNVRVDAAGLNLASLVGPYSATPVGGIGYFQGTVTGELAAPVVSGNIQLLDPRYAHFSADVVRGGVSADRQGVHLSKLVLDRFPASVTVSGSISHPTAPQPRLALNVAVSQADIPDFLELVQSVKPSGKSGTALALPEITGTAGGSLQIGGTLQSPSVSGQATISDAMIGPYEVNSLQLSGSYRKGLVRIAKAVVDAEGARLTAKGQYSVKTQKVAAEFDAQGFDLDRLRSYTNPYARVAGVAGIDGVIGGSLASPTISADVTVSSLTVNNQALAPVSLSGNYANGAFNLVGAPWNFDILPTAQTGHPIEYVVKSLSVSFPTHQRPHRPVKIALAASIPADAAETVTHLISTFEASRYATTPAGEHLLSEIQSLPQPLAGTIAIPNFTMDGTLQEPVITASLNANDLALGSSQMKALSLSGGFRNPEDPTANLHLVGTGLAADGVPITKLTMDATLNNHVLTLAELHAVNQRAYLAASGKADMRRNGAVSADLDASNIPLALLDPLLPQPAQQTRSLTGEIGSFSLAVSGPTFAPDFTTSLDLSHPGLSEGTPGKPPSGSYSLEEIRSGAVTLSTPVPGEAQVLTVTDLSAFQNGKPIATLSGSLPFEWHNKNSSLPLMPEGQPLHAELVVQDLGLLAPFFPAIDAKKTGGSLNAQLNVQNVDHAAQVTGSLDLTGGSIGFTNFDTGLNKIQAHVKLNGERITEAQISADSTKGGSLSVTGGPDMTLTHADLVARSDKLTVNESSKQSLLVKTYGSSFNGQFDGAASAVGSWLTPKISTVPGAPITLSNAAATIPSAPETSGPAAKPPAFDPQFDVTVLLGSPKRTISVGDALLHAQADGNVILSGQLSSPNLKAHLNVAQGQFYLPPATRLQFVRVAQGNSVDIAYPVPAPTGSGPPALRTYVDLTAQTTVSLSSAELAETQSAIPSEMNVGAPTLGTPELNSTTFGQPQTYVITAHIVGVLNSSNLQIDLESSPGGLSHAQMLSALTGVSGLQQLTGSDSQAALQQELADAFYQVGVPTLLNPVEENIAQTLNLSAFAVAYEPDTPVTVTLSKMIGPRLELTYIRSIGPHGVETNTLVEAPEYTVKLSLGLTRSLQLSLSTDNDNDNTIALEGISGF